jgi:hypothetical protein
MKITKSQLKQIIKEEISSVLRELSNGANVGGLAAARDPIEQPFENDPDSEIIRKAYEYFSNLEFTTDVIKYMVTNIAPPDLKILMRKIPKIDTAEQETPQG